jgi:hypothetical protein
MGEPIVPKRAKYWREFTAPTRAEAEKAAASWWAEQRGFDKISGWTMPANASAPGAAPHWTATIIYKPADADAGTPTVH